MCLIVGAQKLFGRILGIVVEMEIESRSRSLMGSLELDRWARARDTRSISVIAKTRCLVTSRYETVIAFIRPTNAASI